MVDRMEKFIVQPEQRNVLWHDTYCETQGQGSYRDRVLTLEPTCKTWESEKTHVWAKQRVLRLKRHYHSKERVFA